MQLFTKNDIIASAHCEFMKYIKVSRFIIVMHFFIPILILFNPYTICICLWAKHVRASNCVTNYGGS